MLAIKIEFKDFKIADTIKLELGLTTLLFNFAKDD